MTNDPVVKVYESNGMYPAEVVKAKLEANGIPVLLKYESVGLVFGLTVDGLGRVDVYVPEELADQALALVAEDGDEVDEGEDGEAPDEATDDAPA